MKLYPTGDRVVVLLTSREETTSQGGVILTGLVTDGSCEGVVLDKGPQVSDHIHIQDRVIFVQYAGNELHFGGKKYVLLKEKDIVARVQDA
jgi:chaperonin GroES